MNIYFNNEEYFYVKRTNLNGVIYTLYMDSNTKSKVLIMDNDNNIILDQYLTNNIMSQVFKKYSEIYANDLDLYEEETLDIKEPYPIPHDKYIQLIDKCKELAYRQFQDILTKEEIDRRIDNNLESIYIDPNLSSLGIYNHTGKRITLSSLVSIDAITLFLYHEFLHSLTYPGVQKVLAFGDSEEYEYGRGIDEGIISNLQEGRKTKKFVPYKENISYPEESELVELLKIVYENTNEAKEKNLNFYDEYIKEPNKLVERINTIYQQNEDYLQKNSEISEKDKTTFGMNKALNFIIDVDELGDKKGLDKEHSLRKLKDELKNLLINQISNDFPTNLKDLYNVLYSLEGFQLKSSNRYEEIDKFKKEVIKRFLDENKDISLDEIEDSLPPIDRQSDLSEEDQRLIILYNAIFRDYSKADPRCKRIAQSISEVRKEKNIKRKNID